MYGNGVYLITKKVIYLQFCPHCGKVIKPDKKYCTSCGGSLVPDALEKTAEKIPVSIPPEYSLNTAGKGGSTISKGFLAVVGLIIILIIVVFAGYPMVTGSGIFPNGKAITPTPVQTLSRNDSSYRETSMVVETGTPIPVPIAAESITNTTLVPTTDITSSAITPQDTKPVVCAADRLKCNNTCIDSQTDNNNCGICDTTCLSDQFCSQGQCMKTCASGETSCIGGCYNLLIHPRHCGSCMNSCAFGLVCVEGICKSPATPMLVPQ
jgi:hypothetical protein